MDCAHCKVPFKTYRAMSGEPWEDCPFSDCPGHGREGEPCWGDMTCYDEFGDAGDMVCMLACEGHHYQAYWDSACSGISVNPRPLYEPRSL